MKADDFQDLHDLVDSAKRHARGWHFRRQEDPSPEDVARAHEHLTHVHGALERLASAVDVLRAEAANALLAHQTDQADGLRSFWDSAVGDREYGFDPDATPGGAA